MSTCNGLNLTFAVWPLKITKNNKVPQKDVEFEAIQAPFVDSETKEAILSIGLFKALRKTNPDLSLINWDIVGELFLDKASCIRISLYKINQG